MNITSDFGWSHCTEEITWRLSYIWSWLTGDLARLVASLVSHPASGHISLQDHCEFNNSLCGEGRIILLAFSLISLNLTQLKTSVHVALLLADKHTYDTSLEVSEEFGSAIKSSLTTLEPVGKFLQLIWLLALFNSHAAQFNLVFRWLPPPQNDITPWFFMYLSQRKMRWCVQRTLFSFIVLHFIEK